jgi:hypothetical protein
MEFSYEKIFLVTNSGNLRPPLRIATLAGKFRQDGKFFLDFLVDILSL